MKWKIKFYAVTIGLPLLVLATVFFMPPQFDETYLGELSCKIERLKQTENHRIIVIGGSSVAFGIRSDLITQEMGREVVNFGLYAPLGSKTMLEACFSEIREGDIVVFSPEQNKETLSFAFQPKEVWEAIDGNFSILRIFDESEIKSLIGYFSDFAASKLKYGIIGKPRVDGIYCKDSFNQYGDIEATGRECNIMPEQYDPTMRIDFAEYPEEEFITFLNEYADRVREKGAEFYYRFCPMNEFSVVDEKELDNYVSRFRRDSNFNIMGNPHECVMESEWFYDTNFHLNESGAIVNTYYFVRDLKAELKDSSKTEITLPEMPVASYETELRETTGSLDDANSRANAGNRDDMDNQENRDAKYFLYEEHDDRMFISGVNEEGAGRKELSIPQFYEGKKVTEVFPGSFENCTQLEKIYVSGGVALHDGCFRGCRSLEKIILNGKPSEIIVGTNLLDETNALIYTEHKEAYCLDYSWGIYSDKIKSIVNE